MNLSIIEAIRQQLAGELPGTEFQLRKVPSIRNPNVKKTFSTIRESAVMILLYPVNDVLHIVYIKRPEYDGPHSGQISFPGGKREKTDESLQHTALRESQEEVGVDTNQIQILGRLTKLFIPVSNSEVHPFVGYSSHPVTFNPDPKEVEFVIEVPLMDIVDPKYSTIVRMHRYDIDILTPMYIFSNDEILGATAIITSEIEEVLWR